MMESTSFAIEIDGEAICIDSQGESEEEDKTAEQPGELGRDAGHLEEIEIIQENDEILNDAEEKHTSIALSHDEFTEELFGKVVHSEEEAYRLYCDYGHHLGFSVRKGKQYYFTGSKRIRTKDYYCSKEGLKDDEQLTEANYNRPETRTNCKAMIRFRVDSQGQWKVIQFVPEHNHDLVRPGERHLLRSVKSLSVPKYSVLNVSGNPEIQVEHEHMHISDGNCFGNGLSTIDCNNEASAQNRIFIDPGDSQKIVNYCKRRSVEDCMFYWDVQVDNTGRITNFFWRDARSRIDYDCFGDVLFFDATHRINKYSLIFIPFVGINNHWQKVMFGCAFLSDESTESFEWLFKSFLVSMGGRLPRSLFTDQNEAMDKAIEEVFPTTRHCICQWHIERSLQSHFSTLCAAVNFRSMFTRCMKLCESEMEFEETWAMMLHEFNLLEDRWFANLYDLRYKWCSTFENDVFNGGIQSAECSESLNNLLITISHESISLTEFMFELDRIVKTWRGKEYEENLRCSQSGADSSTKQNSFLQHASEVYTQKVYDFFEKDFVEVCGTLAFQEIPLGGTLCRFDFMERVGNPISWSVLLDCSTMEVTCSCKRFETMGLLCMHVLTALNAKNMNRIPDRYILKRLTKDAKKRVYEFKQDGSLHHDSSDAEHKYHSRAMLFLYNILMKSEGCKDARRIVCSALEGSELALHDTYEFRSPHMHSLGRDKDPSKTDKRKKKVSKPDKNPRKVKPTLMVTSIEPEYTVPSSENQFFPIEDIASNSSMSRPYFYHQAYPSNGVATNQVHGNMNMHPIPHCATQDYSAYGTLPQTSTFGGGNY